VKELEENFMTQNKFSALVENTVQNSNGLINYIEAVASVCEEYEIEIDVVLNEQVGEFCQYDK
jgi:hypothetical protein